MATTSGVSLLPDILAGRSGACWGGREVLVARWARCWLWRMISSARPVLFSWYNIWVRIVQSARKHGVADDDIRHAVAHAMVIVDRDDGVLHIGADRHGRLLEVIGRSAHAELVVFHAMPLRAVNRRYLL